MECIDFRNARYQGQIKNNKPHGIGVSIDRNHLFCLAEWKNGRIDGPLFAVYPDSKIFCGFMKGSQLSGMCCFYLSDKIKTYLNDNQKSDKPQHFITVLPNFKLIL